MGRFMWSFVNTRQVPKFESKFARLGSGIEHSENHPELHGVFSFPPFVRTQRLRKCVGQTCPGRERGASREGRGNFVNNDRRFTSPPRSLLHAPRERSATTSHVPKDDASNTFTSQTRGQSGSTHKPHIVWATWTLMLASLLCLTAGFSLRSDSWSLDTCTVLHVLSAWFSWALNVDARWFNVNKKKSYLPLDRQAHSQRGVNESIHHHRGHHRSSHAQQHHQSQDQQDREFCLMLEVSRAQASLNNVLSTSP